MLVHQVVFHVLPMQPAYQSQIARPDEFYSFGLAVLARSVENFRSCEGRNTDDAVNRYRSLNQFPQASG